MLVLFLSFTYVIAETPALKIEGAFPPVWHMGYSQRVLAYRNLDAVDSKYPREYVSLTVQATERIPWLELSARMVYLRLSCQGGYEDNALIEDLEDGVIGRRFHLLRFLEIEACRIVTLQKSYLEGLVHLQTLIISTRALTTVREDALSHSENLKWIKFADCKLKEISYKHFENNRQLTFINLYGNDLRDIMWNLNKNHSKANDSNDCEDYRVAINSLVLEQNMITYLKPRMFEPFRLDGILSISDCSMQGIHEDALVGSRGIKTFNLANNSLTSLHPDTLNPARETLQYFSARINMFVSLHLNRTFRGMISLLTFKMENNLIEEIHGTFSSMPNINLIELQSNRISVIQPETFSNSRTLTILRLDNNVIKEIKTGAFRNAKNLLDLNLSNNKLSALESNVFDGLFKLQILKLNSNHIREIEMCLFKKATAIKEIYLQDNELSDLQVIDIPSSDFEIIDLSHNKLRSVPVFVQTRNGKCERYSPLKNVNISHNNLTNLEFDCLANLETIDASFNNIHNIGQTTMSKVPKIRVFKLRTNRLSKIVYPLCPSNIHTRLEHIDLGENTIETITPDVFDNCLKLKTLKLERNLLKIFLPPFNLRSLTNITLFGNNFTCTCENENLITWLNVNKQLNFTEPTCSFENGTLTPLLDLSMNCESNLFSAINVKAIIIPSCSLFVLVAVMSITIYIKRHELQLILFYKFDIRFQWMKISNRTRPRDLTYDIFVSFVDEDAYFVKDQLLQVLEPQYSTCVYYRDFPVGIEIAEAIYDAVDESAVTLIVMSREYIRSRWGVFEFRHAHTMAMHNDDYKLILVILDEDVLNTKLSLMFRSILFAEAYLNVNDEKFFDKLFKCLPTPILKQNCFETITQSDSCYSEIHI